MCVERSFLGYGPRRSECITQPTRGILAACRRLAAFSSRPKRTTTVSQSVSQSPSVLDTASASSSPPRRRRRHECRRQLLADASVDPSADRAPSPVVVSRNYDDDRRTRVAAVRVPRGSAGRVPLLASRRVAVRAVRGRVPAARRQRPRVLPDRAGPVRVIRLEDHIRRGVRPRFAHAVRCVGYDDDTHVSLLLVYHNV